MKLLHIPVLLCSCVRPALYNIDKDLRFVQEIRLDTLIRYPQPPFTTRQTIGPESARYKLWIRRSFRWILRLSLKDRPLSLHQGKIGHFTSVK